MKNKMKKGILVLLVLFVMLFTLSSNIIALTIVGGETHKRGDEIVFTTLDSNDFDKLVITDTELNSIEPALEEDYTKATGGTTTTITLKSEFTNTLYTNLYTIKMYNGNVEVGNSASFTIGPKFDFTGEVSTNPITPKRGQALSFITDMPKDGFVDIKIENDIIPKTDYTLEEGDTVTITFDADYTSNLPIASGRLVQIIGLDKTISSHFDLEEKLYNLDITNPSIKAAEELIFTVEMQKNNITKIEMDDTINLIETTHYTANENEGVTTITVLSNATRFFTLGSHDLLLTAKDGIGTLIFDVLPADYTATYLPINPKVGNAVTFTTNIHPSIINDMTIDGESLTFEDIIPDQDEETGGAIITVKSEYTDKLSATSYEVKIIAINGEATTTLTFKPIEYEVTEILTDAVADGSIVFVADAPFDHFLGFQIDGKTVDPAHYDADEGSIIITLFKKYISKYITPGKTHTITFVLTSGNATKTFKAGNAITAKNPDTGDNLVVFIAIALVVLIVLFIVVKLLQKNKKNKINK